MVEGRDAENWFSSFFLLLFLKNRSYKHLSQTSGMALGSQQSRMAG